MMRGSLSLSLSPISFGSSFIPPSPQKNTAALRESHLQKKCLEAVMKEVSDQGERMGHLERALDEARKTESQISNSKSSPGPGSPGLESSVLSISQEGGGSTKKQTKEIIKLLTRHVGAVEGKISSFEESIHELTQSVAVAHAKLADQDASPKPKRAPRSQTRGSSGGNITVHHVAKRPFTSPVGKRGLGGKKTTIKASPIHPRVVSRRTPEKSRPLAFY